MPSRTPRSPLRRLALVGAAFVVAMLSCGREVTSPGAVKVRYARGLSIQPVFPPILAQVGGSAGLVPFDHVHLVFHHADGSIALDTVVTFAPGTGDLTLTLTVPLAPGAPDAGEPLAFTMDYVNAAGLTVFHGGPLTVLATPSVPGGPPPPPVTIPVNYTGPGANAAHVVIAPRTATVFESDGFNFTAVAVDGAGTPIPGTPIVWTSLDPTLATITAPGAGTGVALSVRGTAHIMAQLLTGPSDIVTVQVVLRAHTIAAQSGDGQSATVSTALGSPLVVRVTASDGVGVGGVPVTFAVATGGGSVGSASVTTDASGFAQSTWHLGAVLGAQTVTASAAGLTGSPVTFTATGLAAVPTRLVVTTQPVSTTAGATLAAVVVTAKDAVNNTATAFTGPVTMAFGNNPSAATLGGTTTVNAVAGVATFSTLTVNHVGTGYTLVASSAGLTSATTAAFDIAAGSGNRLEFGAYPVAGATAGVTIDPITVLARDSAGNPAPTFSGAVTLALGTSPVGATLHGVTTTSAVAGVATFDAVSLTTAGSYTLVASATGVASASGPAFPLTAGPAVALVLVSGGGQSAGGGATLPLPVVVQVTDAFGNAVLSAGRAVTFAVVTGSGSVAPTGATTTASGQASTTWTLGAVIGAQSITAASTGLATLTVGATSTSGIAGPASQLEFSVPPSTTVAGVIIAPTIVVQAKDASNLLATSFIGSVTLAFGANPGASTLSGTLTRTAVAGVATFSNISLNHANVGYTLVASSGALTPGTSPPFAINAGTATTMTISGGSGQTAPANSALPTPIKVTITDALGNVVPGLTVNWAAVTGGGFVSAPTSVTTPVGEAFVTWTLGATVGAQTATATVNGLAGSPATFTATATVAAQVNYDWTGATDTSWTTISNWSVAGLPATGLPATADSVTISSVGHQPYITSPVTIKHLVIVGTCFFSLNNFSTLTIGGQLIDNGPISCGAMRATRAAPRAAASSLRRARLANDVQGDGTGMIFLFGTGDLKGYFVSDVKITGGVRTLVGNTVVVGSVTVSGALTLLDVNGQSLDITGDFTTTSGPAGGRLKMMAPLDADYMTVEGSAFFGGGPTSGLLTHGFLFVYGDFTQGGGAADAFAPDSTHETDIGVSVCGGVCLRSGARSGVQRQLLQRPPSGGGPNARAAQAKARLAQSVKAPSASAVARARVRSALLQRRSALFGTSPDQALPITPFHPMSFSGQSTVSFANPGTGGGTSHFGRVYLDADEMDLLSDVMIEGQLENGFSASHFIVGTNQVLTSHGAAVHNITFDDVRWVLLDGSDVTQLDYIAFMNMDTTVNQFTVQRTGTGAAGSIVPLLGWTFSTVPTSPGHYISAVGPATLIVNMVNPDPAVHGGHIQTVPSTGGAVINWAATFDWVGLGLTNYWSDTLNWNTRVQPSSNDDVFIRATAPLNPFMDVSGSVHNLTIESGKYIDLFCQYYGLAVYGNVVAPLGAEATGDIECHYPLHLVGDGAVGGNTVVGWFGDVNVDGNYKVSGTGNQLIVTDMLKVEGTGNLSVNGGRVDVGGLGGALPGHGQFYTEGSGTLTMTNAADQMFVGSLGAHFEGGSTTGLLTAGTLTLFNGFVQTQLGVGAPDAFAPSGTHTTVFGGTSSAAFFGDPASSWLQNASILIGSGMELRSDVGVKGWLSHGTGTGAVQVFATISVPATPLLTVSGLNFGSANTVGVSNVMFKFVDGTSNVTFDNVTWNGFPAPFSMDVFTVARSDATALTFNGHNFLVSVDSVGHYLKNLGSANIHMATPTPSTVTPGLEIIASGTGLITWP